MADIKTRYYELAKQYHPDANTDPESIKRFVSINEAYQTLGDSRKKKIYDDSFDFKDNEQELYNHKNRKRSAKRENEYSEPFNEHDEFFKKGASRIKPKRGEDIYEKLNVSLTESVKGVLKKIMVSRKHTCTDCDPASARKCFACGGKGHVHIYSDHTDQECSKCSGKGYKNNCETCGGEEYLTETIE